MGHRTQLARHLVAGAVVAAAMAITTSAAAEPLRLSFEDALDRARSAPLVRAARASADAASRSAEAEKRAAYLPTLAVVAGVTARDRELSLVTPAGAFPFGDQVSPTAAARLTQPLFDARAWLYDVPAAREEARAAALVGDRTRKEQAAIVAARYLDVLELDARGAAMRAHVLSLEARHDRVRALAAEGRALGADALEVELALEDARHQVLVLSKGRAVAARALGQSLGVDGAVEPIADSLPAPGEVGDVEAAATSALRARSNLRALSAEVAGFRKRASGARASFLPTLEATGSAIFDGGAPYDDDHWLEGSIQLRWVPFAAATRSAASDALDRRAAAAAARLEDARRGVAVEVHRWASELVTARDELAVADRGAAQAAEALRIEEGRYQVGGATMNDLLDREAVLLNRETRRRLARLAIVRAQVLLDLAAGRL